MPRTYRIIALCWMLLTSLLATVANAQDPRHFPRPAVLEPAIQFWTRVYTEVDTDSGFLHDANDLGVIYKRVEYDRPEIEQQRTRIQDDLKVLATGKRIGLTGHQQQILEAFPAGVSNQKLADSANSVRFQLGQSDRFVEGLIRSGAYRQHIDQVTAERNLPAELGALPHVESSFHPGAYSHANAAGMWQFIRATGQRYMRIDHIVDERMDPYTSTHAAMSLLEHNYSILGTWPLALTAYNHGAGGLNRAVRETGSNKIEDIIMNYKGPSFGFASRNFYPQFLAVLDVEKQANALFGILQLDSHPEYAEVELESYIEAQTLANALNITLEQLKFDNPAIRPIVWQGGKRIPRGYTVKLQRKSLERDMATMLAAIPAEYRYAYQTPDLSYVVQRGDSLSGIATRFNTSVSQLMSLNQLRDAHRIQIGQNILLPHDNAVAQTAARQVASAPSSVAAGSASRQPQVRPASYEVRGGDTVSTIAQRFGMSAQELLRINNIDNPNRIYPGQRLSLVSAQVVEASVQPAVILAVAGSVAALSSDNFSDSVAEEPVFNLAASNEQASVDLTADPSDYNVKADNTIEIQPTETLGHYAEWLGVPSADIRRWNNLSGNQPVVMGNRLRLNFTAGTAAEFELKRRQYHVAQQENFFRNYRIQELDQYTVAANDNISQLANQKYSVPIWLLRQYNPDLDLRLIRVGQKVVFPVLERVEAENRS